MGEDEQKLRVTAVHASVNDRGIGTLYFRLKGTPV